MEIPDSITQPNGDLYNHAAAFLTGDGYVEWEFAFGRGSTSGYFGSIHRGLFRSIHRRLKDIPGLTTLPPTETLDISVWKDSTQFPIRITLEGRERIVQFCREDKAVKQHFKYLYKSRAADPVSLKEYGIVSNLKRETPVYLDRQVDDAVADGAITDLVNHLDATGGIYDVYKTFRYKKRMSYRTSDGFQFDLTIVKASETRDYVTRSGKLVEKSIPERSFHEANILNQPETYEVEIEAHYHTIYTDVASPPEDDPDADGGELDETRLGDAELISNVCRRMIQVATPILQVQQDSRCVTADTMAMSVLKNYRKLLQEDALQSLLEESRVSSNQNLEKYGYSAIPTGTYPSTFDFVGPKPVSLDMQHLHPSESSSAINILDHYTVTDKADGEGNILYVDNEGDAYLIDASLRVRSAGFRLPTVANSILNGEYITSNRDGEPRFAFYAYDAYVVNGIPVWLHPLCVPVQAQSIDIKKRSKAKKKITVKKGGAVADMLNAHIEETPSFESRLEAMHRFVALYQSGAVNQSDSLDVKVKTFYYHGSPDNPVVEGATSTSIFELSEKCWAPFLAGISPYTYDGLIYTPMHLPVSYPGSRVQSQWQYLRGKTWEWNFKWKPPRENTIDFHVHTEQNTVYKRGSTEIKREVVRKTTQRTESAEVLTKSYKTLQLYVGGQLDHPSCYKARGKGPYGKKSFQPNADNVDRAPICMKGNEIVGRDDGNVIEDGTVVEFSYAANTPDDNIFRWIPKRTRYDKTFQTKKHMTHRRHIYTYVKQLCISRHIPSNFTTTEEWRSMRLYRAKGRLFEANRGCLSRGRHLDISTFLLLVEEYYREKGHEKEARLQFLKTNFNRVITSVEVIPVRTIFANDENVANHVWKTIQFPITEAMITSGKDIPPLTVADEVYYHGATLSQRSRSRTISLQRYHNFIKRHVLLERLRDIPHCTILDLACGKGGDLPKWKSIGAEIVVGTDLSHDNLENPMDGACQRYANMKEENTSNVPYVAFFQADSRQDVVEQLGQGPADKVALFKQLWYEMPSDAQTLPTPQFSLVSNRFHAVSLQFALHYFWESMASLRNLLSNVHNNLRTGGVFMGTCLDGAKVAEGLVGRSTLEGHHKGDILWRITKRYPDDQEGSVNPVGKAIDVYMSSIQKTHTEYLVDFHHLVEMLNKVPYSMSPLTREEATVMGLPASYDTTTGTCSFGHIAKQVSGGTLEGGVPTRELSFMQNTLRQMTPAEEKISFLSTAFVYKKREIS